MISRIHQRLGTAGFIISIVALVAALGGGAYAASGGLNGKQKKEVEKIAKKYAGKPGASGAAGPAGAGGSKGEKGDKGDAGASGGSGKSVVTANYEGPECPTITEEGISVEVEGSGAKKYVCAGERGAPGPRGDTGSPWTAGGTLPPHATETGTWTLGTLPEAATALGSPVYVPVSFSVPLAAELETGHVHFINAAGQEVVSPVATQPSTACLGSAADPTANAGQLCVYASLESNVFTYTEFIRKSDSPTAGPGSAGTAGAVISFFAQAAASMAAAGTWAVQAPAGS